MCGLWNAAYGASANKTPRRSRLGNSSVNRTDENSFQVPDFSPVPIPPFKHGEGGGGGGGQVQRGPHLRYVFRGRRGLF